MEGAVELRQLIEAQRRVAESSAQIQRQCCLVEDLERKGLDTVEARELLETFQDAYMLLEQERDRLRANLAMPAAALSADFAARDYRSQTPLLRA